jgi:hypothetical protein
MSNYRRYPTDPLISPGRIARQTLLLISGFVARQCRHFYYRTRESLGQHKRELVVCRVEDATNSLQETRLHFEDALEKFKAIVEHESNSLENRYKQLKIQFDISQAKANSVSDRIRAIEDVSEALFREWEAELKLYANRSLRAQSRQQLKVTRQHYGRLIKAMHRAEAKINPVLSAFRDQVLFLKHNLNAQAIAALQNELVEISIDIMHLIHAMENSINEANSFVLSLVEQKALPRPGGG